MHPVTVAFENRRSQNGVCTWCRRSNPWRCLWERRAADRWAKPAGGRTHASSRCTCHASAWPTFKSYVGGKGQVGRVDVLPKVFDVLCTACERVEVGGAEGGPPLRQLELLPRSVERARGRGGRSPVRNPRRPPEIEAPWALRTTRGTSGFTKGFFLGFWPLSDTLAGGGGGCPAARDPAGGDRAAGAAVSNHLWQSPGRAPPRRRTWPSRGRSGRAAPALRRPQRATPRTVQRRTVQRRREAVGQCPPPLETLRGAGAPSVGGPADADTWGGGDGGGGGGGGGE